MKVIFLDVDGVLNYIGSPSLDDECFRNLQEIVQKTDAKILLISTWRIAYQSGMKHPMVSLLNSKFEQFGLELYGLAPYLNDRRSVEVSMYLGENDVSQYLIIDDTDYEYSKKHNENWVRPNSSSGGLTSKLAQKSIEILLG